MKERDIILKEIQEALVNLPKESLEDIYNVVHNMRLRAFFKDESSPKEMNELDKAA